MSRWLGRAGAAVILVSAGALLAPGCAYNESSMYVRAALHVPTATCEVEADATAAALNNGVFDVTIANSYSASLLIANQLLRRGDPDRLRIETSKVELYGADVTLLRERGGKGATFFSSASGFADASPGTTPGLGVVSVVLINAAAAADLREELGQGGSTEVTASVVVHGRTLGGVEVESWDWPFPIHVCAGCLCDRSLCGAGADDTNAPQLEANCRPGQDDAVDCRLKVGICQ